MTNEQRARDALRNLQCGLMRSPDDNVGYQIYDLCTIAVVAGLEAGRGYQLTLEDVFVWIDQTWKVAHGIG